MVQVIEQHHENGVHWYVSFDGYNPTEDKSYLCKDENQAIRLQRLINSHIRKYYSTEVLLSKDEGN